MLYSDLLAKVHEVLEERLKALSGEPTGETTLAGGPILTSSPSEASTSAVESTTTTRWDAHKAFGASIQNWPIFPDTCAALRRLAKHFKLVVLSNVDRESFRHTHALLSEGPSWDTVTANRDIYAYPFHNSHKYWHPQATEGSKSPFTLVLTAQDTGCYKPALGGFRSVFEYIAEQPELFGDIGLAQGEEVKDKVISVAQSLQHDHEPASQLGMRSVWIDRQQAVTCNVNPGGPGAKPKWTWRFETLGEMADAVEKELEGSV